MTDADLTELSAHDLQSTLAGKLRKHIESRRQSLRVKNDGDLDPVTTAKLRGELKAYKDLSNLLALVKKPDQVTGADEEQTE